MVQKRLGLKIHGQIQGVGFRWSAREKAQALGLTGWVRNCADGTVEAIIEGIEENLKEFMAWCYNGNSVAIIDNVDEKWEEATGEYQEFEIY